MLETTSNALRLQIMNTEGLLLFCVLQHHIVFSIHDLMTDHTLLCSLLPSLIPLPRSPETGTGSEAVPR